MALTERVRTRYENDGFAVLRDVIDDDGIEAINGHFEYLEERFPDTRPEELGKHKEYMRQDPFWVRTAAEERLLDVAKEILGPNLVLFTSGYIAKPPGDGQAVLWHQDGSYWPLEPMEVMTVWLAVTESTVENGCVRYVPGSHEMELQNLEDNTEVDNVFDSGMDESLIDESEAVDVELEPGDVSIHHPNTVHGSNPNTSDTWRRGMTFRYIPTTTKITSEDPFGRRQWDEDEPWPSTLLLSGDPKPCKNRYFPWPRFEEGGEGYPFDGADAYNERAERMNDRARRAGCLIE